MRTLWVSPSGTNWRVHWEKESNGSTYTTKAMAIQEAKRIVRSLPAGSATSIRVQLANGQIQTEWTYGKDSYPPKG